MTVERARPVTLRMVEKDHAMDWRCSLVSSKIEVDTTWSWEIPGPPPGVVWWRKGRKVKVGFGG